MDPANFEFAGKIISSAYIEQALQARHQREKLIKILLSQRRIPTNGWDDQTIEMFITELSAMDSNNFLENAGAGEREGRVFSQLVAKRHYRLAHGIGRSGDIAADQPKAAGSSLIYALTNKMTLDIIKLAGITKASSALVLPTATGMSLSLCFLTLNQKKPQSKFILWTRIDQKSCFKSITTAGFEPVVIENKYEGNELVTDLEAIEKQIVEKGAENILCVFSTTSCFAPRGYDRVQEIAQLCKKHNLFHVINNAYGLQDTYCSHIINEAIRLGEVTYFVQSTDKNFMVPVGGAVVASPDEKLVDAVSKLYPGRASVAPILDLFMTFLSMGEVGWKKLLQQRKALYEHGLAKIQSLAAKHNEKVLMTLHNKISIAMSLSSFSNEDVSYLGSMLFSRGCSGSRIVKPKVKSTIGSTTFIGYGSHTNEYPVPYITFAAGTKTKEKIEVE